MLLKLMHLHAMKKVVLSFRSADENSCMASNIRRSDRRTFTRTYPFLLEKDRL